MEFLIGLGVTAANAVVGFGVNYALRAATAQKNAYVLERSCFETLSNWKVNLQPPQLSGVFFGAIKIVDLEQRIKMLVLQYHAVRVIQSEGVARTFVIGCVGDPTLKFVQNDQMGPEFGNYIYRELIVDAGAILHMHGFVSGRFSVKALCTKRSYVTIIPTTSAYILEMLLIRLLRHIAMVLYALSVEWTELETHIMRDSQFQYLFNRTYHWETVTKVPKDQDNTTTSTGSPLRRHAVPIYVKPDTATPSDIEDATMEDYCYGYGEMITKHSQRVSHWYSNAKSRTVIPLNDRQRALDPRRAALFDWHQEFCLLTDGIKGQGELKGTLPYYTRRAASLALVLSGVVYYEMNPTLPKSDLKDEFERLPKLVQRTRNCWGSKKRRESLS